MAVRRMKGLRRGALVVAAGVVANALGFGFLILAALAGSDGAAVGIIVLGPLSIGAVVALVATRRTLRWVATATFIALGAVGLVALGPDGRAEGGGELIVWIVIAELIGLYVAAGIRSAASRRQGRIDPIAFVRQPPRTGGPSQREGRPR